ncbi:MBL fold metallo-hydrolase [Pseudonocardia sp. KRD291]|uniref:MBL fold metallo-hydrolase n=1 Tax=Pseudonocardia sp. KRD291 TaxID=2792007 RepID=UPI001C4A0A5E|nr:MBL fold metallo-hydrolase [Pseudonocardia sp. KRD291]MBW0102418.1 hypothetical protein [Pseudonocardia sp. KRD291]
MSVPARAPVVELVPDRLHLLGDGVELDGRISWVPPHVRGWQPMNCYVLREAGSVLVIDPGPAVLRETVADQLETLVPAGTPVSVLVTRAEPDTTGGLGEIARRFPVERLYAGGGPNPFDSFEALGELAAGSGRGAGRRERIQLERTAPGFAVAVGPARGVEILRPSIRLLATWWGFDQATGTLFTSDSFGHSVQSRRDGPRVLRGDDVAPEPVEVIAHLRAKFGWLAHARTPVLRERTRDLFAGRAVTRIAPAHGLVIEGPEAVRAHLDAMDAALHTLSS